MNTLGSFFIASGLAAIAIAMLGLIWVTALEYKLPFWIKVLMASGATTIAIGAVLSAISKQY
jgi:hypothetical protein